MYKSSSSVSVINHTLWIVLYIQKGEEGINSITFSHVQCLLNVLESVSAVNELLARLQTVGILCQSDTR